MNNTLIAFDLIGLTVGVIYIIYKINDLESFKTNILLQLAEIKKKLNKNI